MDRRRFLLTSVASALVVPLRVEGQQAGKMWRIGSVLVGTPETVGHLNRAIEASLTKAGYVSGRNITLVQQIAPPQPARVEEVLGAIIPTLDLLIVGSTIGGVAAKKITTTLPTVFVSVGDPVRIGLVSSLRRLSASRPRRRQSGRPASSSSSARARSLSACQSAREATGSRSRMPPR
jgi:hypothetical protein